MRRLGARRPAFEGKLPRVSGCALVVGGVAVVTSANLLSLQRGEVEEGFLYITPHGPSLVYYGSFFVLGYVFHHYREFLRALVPNFWRWAAMAAVMFPIAVHLSGLDNAVRGRDTVLHVWAVLANGLCTWALIYAFIGGALRFFDRDSPWIQYVSQSSYWVFLVHMPLVSLAAYWLVQFDLPAMLKFLLACGFTALVAFLTFHYWVQKSWLSVFLHGRRFDLAWPWRQAGRDREQTAQLS